MTPAELAAIRERDAANTWRDEYLLVADRDRRALLAHVDDLTAQLAAQGRDVCDFDYPAGSAPCMCYFSTAEKRGPDPIGECDYHANLRKRLAACERDAERLDALERDWYGLIMVRNEKGWLPWKSDVDYQPTLRAAIDAARSETWAT